VVAFVRRLRDSVFERYNVVSEADLGAGVAKLDHGKASPKGEAVWLISSLVARTRRNRVMPFDSQSCRLAARPLTQDIRPVGWLAMSEADGESNGIDHGKASPKGEAVWPTHP
jgi:hypothetical protein